MYTTAERVAVIGSGVAGPTASYLLRHRYEVLLFGVEDRWLPRLGLPRGRLRRRGAGRRVVGGRLVNTPALYDATVAHIRPAGPPMSFVHRISLWLVDLDELPELPRPLRPFARFDGRDHFAPQETGSIRVKLERWLSERGVDLAGGRVLMPACARVLGYAFNPITTYWCYRPDGTLACVVAEVYNTEGDRHAYPVQPDLHAWASVAKEFFVSPFQQQSGDCLMHLPRPESLLSETVVFRDGDAGGPALTATLRGVRRPVTGRWLVRSLAARALVPQRVAGLIRRHGLGLWLLGAPRPSSTLLGVRRVVLIV